MSPAAHDEGDDGRDEARPLDLALWRRLWRTTRPYRREVALLAAAGLATALVDAAFPLVTARVIDEVAARGADADLRAEMAAYAGLSAALALLVLAFLRLGGRIRTAVAHDIRRDGFASLQRLSFAWFDRRPVGWLMARMTSDCERLSNILAWGVLDLFWGTALMAAIAAVMLAVEPLLALVVLSVAPALVWVSLRFKRRILGAARAVRRANARLTAAYDEGIQGVRTAKTFVREREDRREFGRLAADMHGAALANQLNSALFLPLILTLGSVATGLALVAGGAGVRAGTLSIGTLVAFMTYTARFFEPLQQIAHWFAEMQMAQAAAERVLGLVEEVPEIRDSDAVRARIAAAARAPAPGTAPDGLPDALGRIELRDVCFRYGDGPPVLEGFSLELRPGERVALVGSTGGGKSTIAALVCRFYEPTSGAILVDGVDLRERSLAWLRSKLAVVQQHPHLFGGTIAENVRYGRLEATDEEVERAARIAGAHELVARLEHGYATQVGEGGLRLSTGEKQLVSLARAVLADPALLVLDEATSSIDTETERRIQEGLEALLAGRTSLVIAHRLSTIRRSDRILVVEHGRIVEQGSHRELLGLGGRYHELYLQQSLAELGRDGRAWAAPAAAAR